MSSKTPLSILCVNMTSKKYYEYLKSFGWKAKREKALRKANGKCEVCGKTSGLAAHHTSYKNAGNERPSDLQILCKSCHVNAHIHGNLFIEFTDTWKGRK